MNIRLLLSTVLAVALVLGVACSTSVQEKPTKTTTTIKTSTSVPGSDTQPPTPRSSTLHPLSPREDRFKVAWQVADDNVSSSCEYQVEYRKKDTNEWLVKHAFGSLFGFEPFEPGYLLARITDLEASAVYQVRVIARDEALNTVTYNLAEVTTRAPSNTTTTVLPVIPGLPNDASIQTVVGPGLVRLEWRPIDAYNPATEKYEFFYRISGQPATEYQSIGWAEEDGLLTTPEGRLRYTVIGLAGNTTYQFLIKGSDAGGSVDYPAVEAFVTEP